MPRPPKKYQAPTDDVAHIAARERFEAAMNAVGPWLCDVLLHVAVLDLPVAEWRPMNGRAKTHGIGVLHTRSTAVLALRPSAS